jgi:hypothetical protein
MNETAEAIQQDRAEPYAFTERELARLAIYRAAVAAGFYTDACDPVEVATGLDSYALPCEGSTDTPRSEAYFFDAAATERLARYKAAVASGLYNDGQVRRA